MRLLFDNNLSPRLVPMLSDVLVEAQHVATMNLGRATDAEVWEFAREHAYTIVTKDSDFSELTTILGAPPRVVWLRLGNCATAQVDESIRSHLEAISDFIRRPDSSTFEIFPTE